MPHTKKAAIAATIATVSLHTLFATPLQQPRTNAGCNNSMGGLMQGKTRRAWILGLLTALLTVAGLVGAAPAANAANPATVMADTQRMTDTNLTQGAIQYGIYKKGQPVTLVCYARGQSVWGHYSSLGAGWDNLWYMVNDGYWAADIDINTGSNAPVTGPCPTINTSTYYLLTNRNSGRAIDVRGGSAASGAALQQYTINKSPAQQFKFTPTGAGYYKLTSLVTDAQVWDAAGGQAVNGTKVQTWAWAGVTQQQWRPMWDAGGNVSFRPRHADGQCVDVPGGSTVNSVQLQLYSCNWTNAQKFSMAAQALATSKVDQFVSANTGKILATPEGTFPGQCVSLVRQYLWQVYGIYGGAWGNAIDYRSGGTGGKQLAGYGFSWATDQNFVNGDILVWGDDPGTMTGAYGHIGVWYNGKIFDQNDRQSGRNVTNPQAAGLSPVFSAGYLGRWRK